MAWPSRAGRSDRQFDSLINPSSTSSTITISRENYNIILKKVDELESKRNELNARITELEKAEKELQFDLKTEKDKYAKLVAFQRSDETLVNAIRQMLTDDSELEDSEEGAGETLNEVLSLVGKQMNEIKETRKIFVEQNQLIKQLDHKFEDKIKTLSVQSETSEKRSTSAQKIEDTVTKLSAPIQCTEDQGSVILLVRNKELDVSDPNKFRARSHYDATMSNENDRLIRAGGRTDRTDGNLTSSASSLHRIGHASEPGLRIFDRPSLQIVGASASGSTSKSTYCPICYKTFTIGTRQEDDEFQRHVISHPE